MRGAFAPNVSINPSKRTDQLLNGKYYFLCPIMSCKVKVAETATGLWVQQWRQDGPLGTILLYAFPAYLTPSVGGEPALYSSNHSADTLLGPIRSQALGPKSSSLQRFFFQGEKTKQMLSTTKELPKSKTGRSCLSVLLSH